MPDTLAARLTRVRDRIATAAHRCERDPSEIELLAVSKFHPVEAVAEAIEAGQRVFGENRLQGAAEKVEAVAARYPELADELRWHFIGGLQSNKIRPVLEHFDMIESLERSKHLNRVARIGEEIGRTVPCLLQVNISGAATQGGLEPENVAAFLDGSGEDHPVPIHGLMAIGPNTDDEGVIRRAFAQLRQLAEELDRQQRFDVKSPVLSMGMTGDLEIAIEEGSTLVRVGTAIFGPRPT